MYKCIILWLFLPDIIAKECPTLDNLIATTYRTFQVRRTACLLSDNTDTRCNSPFDRENNGLTDIYYQLNSLLHIHSLHCTPGCQATNTSNPLIFTRDCCDKDAIRRWVDIPVHEQIYPEWTKRLQCLTAPPTCVPIDSDIYDPAYIAPGRIVGTCCNPRSTVVERVFIPSMSDRIRPDWAYKFICVSLQMTETCYSTSKSIVISPIFDFHINYIQHLISWTDPDQVKHQISHISIEHLDGDRILISTPMIFLHGRYHNIANDQLQLHGYIHATNDTVCLFAGSIPYTESSSLRRLPSLLTICFLLTFVL